VSLYANQRQSSDASAAGVLSFQRREGTSPDLSRQLLGQQESAVDRKSDLKALDIFRKEHASENKFSAANYRYVFQENATLKPSAQKALLALPQ